MIPTPAVRAGHALRVDLTWQALRGQSIIAPDPLTISAFAMLAAAVALSSLLVLANARLQRTPTRSGAVA